jgi:alpha/beta superfamily hydrolase
MGLETRGVSFVSAGQPAVRLEGRLRLPAAALPSSAAVIAHPHPQWGGTMASSVVVQIAQALAERGCAALRFNFRGVGWSEGSYADGSGEVDDVRGALDYVAGLFDHAKGCRLAAVGYSFGAWVAARATCTDERVRVYAAVALPMSNAYSIDLSACRHPKCFITGELDTISPPELLRQYVGALPEPKTLHVIPGADHFLQGYEREAAELVADCVLDAIT